MRKTISKEEVKVNTKEERKPLTEAFALWLRKSKAGQDYLSGLTADEIGKDSLVAYFNSNKKNPKEPDVRVYLVNAEGKQDKEVASLWENISKNEKRYLTGISDDKEKLIGFYGDKADTKHPYIRVCFKED